MFFVIAFDILVMLNRKSVIDDHLDVTGHRTKARTYHFSDKKPRTGNKMVRTCLSPTRSPKTDITITIKMPSR